MLQQLPYIGTVKGVLGKQSRSLLPDLLSALPDQVFVCAKSANGVTHLNGTNGLTHRSSQSGVLNIPDCISQKVEGKYKQEDSYPGSY